MAEPLQPQDKPSYCNEAYDQMAAAQEIMADVSGGTLQMRKRGKKYLPEEPKEKKENYDIRLSRAIFFNAVERTLNGLVGMVFRKEPKLGEDVPIQIRGTSGNEGSDQQELGLLRQFAQIAMDFDWNPEGAVPTDAGLWARILAFLARIKELIGQYQEWLDGQQEPTEKIQGYWENIDNAGTKGNVFAQELFTDAMRDGHALIYVDAPKLPTRSDGLKPTQGDLRDFGWRPYWQRYKASQIINWRTEIINGQMRLSQVTLKEESLEPDGLYGEKKVCRYRVLVPGEWYLFKEVKGEGAEVQYLPDGNGETGLRDIPVAVVYTRKKAVLCSQPSLLDLALVNIAHYQKYSDHSTYLHIASRPILWFRNRDVSKKVEPIGPYTFFDVGLDGTVDFAETTGAALSSSREDLKDLEGQMAALGLSIIAGKSPQPNTATAELLDHVQEESDLATAARSLKDCLELALTFLAQYEEPTATSGGSVELGATLEELTLSPQEMQQYSNMASLKQLSLDTFWAIMDRAGKLPAGFDPKMERGKIKADAATTMNDMLTQFERGNNQPDLGDPGDNADTD